MLHRPPRLGHWLVFSLALLALPALGAPLQLALNWKADPEFGGFYAAQTQGLFQAQKLNVKLIEGGSGTPTVQMLAAGEVDYAIVSADEIAIAHDRGARNIVALYASFQTNPQAIMTRAGRGFHSIADILHGDGVLLWQNGLAYAQYLDKKYAPVTVTTAPYLGGIGNFVNDPKISQQCFISSEPLAATKAGVKVRTFLIADSGYNPYTVVLATTREHLRQHPDEVRRLVAATRAGWQAYLADPGPANAAMAQLNQAMTPATFAASARAQRDLIAPAGLKQLGTMSLERWQTLVDQLRGIGVIRHPVDAAQLFLNL